MSVNHLSEHQESKHHSVSKKTDSTNKSTKSRAACEMCGIRLKQRKGRREISLIQSPAFTRVFERDERFLRARSMPSLSAMSIRLLSRRSSARYSLRLEVTRRESPQN
ncbi:hypothetical protein BLNAU_9469 [Blattamonas nauphoetae]|uniref:Uncharacterized protein n=1 Tax=Blattamonas nauphoetae TaxID=2049346 RepID=A0ABQ9XVX2_9EUKA|nr:hypothetical protein BLNAU_9469 [Blattamonas nauphoetae]